MKGWATQRGPRPWLVPTSHRLASCVIVSVFRAVLDLDTYPLSTLFVHGALNWLNFLALVALKLLVSLISRLVACSARIVEDKYTYTDRTTTVALAAHARRGFTHIATANVTAYPK